MARSLFGKKGPSPAGIARAQEVLERAAADAHEPDPETEPTLNLARGYDLLRQIRKPNA